MENTKILFDKSLLIGNPSIDSEHKQLFKIYGMLLSSVKLSKFEVATILDELKEYTQSHFMKEEYYMERMKYPNLKAHKEAHQEFICKVAELIFELENTFFPETLTEKIKVYIVEWLSKHIKVVDKEYENYKLKNNITLHY